MKNGAPISAVMMPTSSSVGPGHDAADHVGGDQQARAGERRERQQPAVVDADEEPAQVRDDEPDEPDGPGDGGGRAAQQHRAERRDAAGEGDALAEPGGELVAEREGVEAARRQQADGEARRRGTAARC